MSELILAFSFRKKIEKGTGKPMAYLMWKGIRMKVTDWSISKCKKVHVLHGKVLFKIPVAVRIKRAEAMQIGLRLHGKWFTYMCWYGFQEESSNMETKECIKELMKMGYR